MHAWSTWNGALDSFSCMATGKEKTRAKGRKVRTETPVTMDSVTVSFLSLRIAPRVDE